MTDRAVGSTGILEPDPRSTSEGGDDLAEAVAALVARAGDLHVSLGEAEEGWVPWDALAEDGAALEEALARVGEFTPGLDDKARAAFLAQMLAHRLGYALAALAHAGVALDLSQASLHVRWEAYTWEDEGESGQDNHILLRASHDASLATDGPPWGEAARRVLVRRLEPLVRRLAQRSGLGRAALWRQAADGVASAYLEAGRDLGLENEAVAEAETILRAKGSPLTNRQTGFVTITATDEGGRCLSECFRARGGCCRWYTIPGAATDEDPGWCTTCVLRPEPDRNVRLRTHVARKLADLHSN